jgi:CDP-paratose 2-epimerase
VGAKLTDRLATAGTPVTVLDSLVRPGAEENARRLKEKCGDLVRVEIGDVQDRFAVRRALDGADRVFHLAGQVSGDAALADPRGDLDVNVLGTMNVLEEARLLADPPMIVFASASDAGEGPQACSKAAAEHYVLEYARSFRLRTHAIRSEEAGDLVEALLGASAPGFTAVR